MAPEQTLVAGDYVSDLESRVEYLRHLADIFHELLSEQSSDALLHRVAATLKKLIPYDSLTVYEVDRGRGLIVPLLAMDTYADEIMNGPFPIGTGLTGWAVERGEPVLANEAHADPRTAVIPGTPMEPEALISVPLKARGTITGALNVYRLGHDAGFTEAEFDIVKRFADAAALALDNASIRDSLERQANTDPLTGLFNHRYFHERLRAELNRASRNREPLTLLVIDIDDFKRVNDVYGHAAGDQVLTTVAEVLSSNVREFDIPCRIGGEEFAVVLPSSDGADAMGFASRFLEKIATTDFSPAGRITISVGIASSAEHGMNARELLGSADTAMLTAKGRGKDQVVMFTNDVLVEANDPSQPGGLRDGRSISHLKMLRSLAGKLNRLNEVRQIGMTIANELRTLIDYHNCRVYLREEDMLIPIAFRGELSAYDGETPEILAVGVGEGITGHAAETGRSLLVPNALECEFAVEVPGTEDIEESMVAVPLNYGTRVIGAIVISKLGVAQFDEDDVRLMEVLAGQASVALENARLYEAQRLEAENAKDSAAVANALLDVSGELASAVSLEEVLDSIIQETSKTMASETVSVWLEEPDSGHLRVEALTGYDELQRLQMASIRVPTDRLYGMLPADRPLILNSGEVNQILGRDVSISGTFWVAPIRSETRFGILVAAPTAVNGHADRKKRLLVGIANQAKLAIDSAISYESLEQTFYSTVEALANALEAKDEYTSDHARSITDMCLDVGRALGIEGKDLKRLELGALFHDIGKIGISSEILLKPGPLTDAEREAMKRHPELGEQILRPIGRLEDVLPIVRHCHEHHDGTGYPDGLKGDEIPLESRIILTCDAFDAMTTDRPYRKRMPVSEGCRRLEQSAGTQFDPKIVEVFLSLIRSQPTFAQGH
ncbi:MAG: diguanylate cyclase [Actinobacteria bacterium]|nr:diguanylate cyclase [Actinomycetota bacterium]